MVDPTTPDEWRSAAVCATVFLAIDSARQYGLVTGGPRINVERCRDILTRAKALSIEPTAAEVAEATPALLAQINGAEK